ncbi:MAG: hypothetical protein ABIS36_18610 [Chryseolinea sp.]
MKTITIQFLYILSMAAILCMGSCNSTDPDPSSGINGVPIVTAVGTPTGNATSEVIGALGGSVTSADGIVSLSIPEGALDGNTVIAVEGITNNAPLGISGAAYRFTPDGQQFKKPVKITFKYSTVLSQGTEPHLLWIVTQAQDGSWQALLKSNVSTDAQTVSGEINHFSDWGIGKFIDLTLEPASPILAPGKSIDLRVSGFIANTDADDELAPLIPSISKSGDSELKSLSTLDDVSIFKIVQWDLEEDGSLSPHGFSATYTAPSKIPTRNPVAVSVELERFGANGKPVTTFSKVLLVSNVTIGEKGMTVNFKGTEYKFPQDAGKSSIVVAEQGIVLIGGDGTFPTFSFIRSLKAAGSHTHTCVDLDLVSSNFSATDSYFNSWIDSNNGPHCGSFTSDITTLGQKQGEIITGSFSGLLFKAGDTSGTPFPISGYFNLERIN